MSKLPVRTGASYALSAQERKWAVEELDRIDGLDAILGLLDEHEQEILKDGLCASFGYWHLEEVNRFVERIFPADDWNGQEIRWYLKRATAGFKLAMALAETSLEERQKVLLAALTTSRKAANARWAQDPASQAMREVRKEWDAWQSMPSSFRSDAAFARAMAAKYPAITNESSIKNACNRWRKEQSSSS